MGILSGKWVLTAPWLVASLAEKGFTGEEGHEVRRSQRRLLADVPVCRCQCAVLVGTGCYLVWPQLGGRSSVQGGYRV